MHFWEALSKLLRITDYAFSCNPNATFVRKLSPPFLHVSEYSSIIPTSSPICAHQHISLWVAAVRPLCYSCLHASKRLVVDDTRRCCWSRGFTCKPWATQKKYFFFLLRSFCCCGLQSWSQPRVDYYCHWSLLQLVRIVLAACIVQRNRFFVVDVKCRRYTLHII